MEKNTRVKHPFLKDITGIVVSDVYTLNLGGVPQDAQDCVLVLWEESSKLPPTAHPVHVLERVFMENKDRR